MVAFHEDRGVRRVTFQFADQGRAFVTRHPFVVDQDHVPILRGRPYSGFFTRIDDFNATAWKESAKADGDQLDLFCPWTCNQDRRCLTLRHDDIPGASGKFGQGSSRPMRKRSPQAGREDRATASNPCSDSSEIAARYEHVNSTRGSGKPSPLAGKHAPALVGGGPKLCTKMNASAI